MNHKSISGPAASGYLAAPTTLEDLGRLLLNLGVEAKPSYPVEIDDQDADLAPIDGVDIGDLSSSGWGVVFSALTPATVVEALAPLLDHRRNEAARYDKLGFRAFHGQDGYRQGERATDFLRRVGARVDGPAVPEALPYYLLLVGSPNEIPFSFQYDLDVEYAVGRIWFETPEEYHRYAQAVVSAENRVTAPAKQVVFFAPGHRDGKIVEPLTQLSIERLVRPLAQKLDLSFGGEQGSWDFEVVADTEASKARLASILVEETAPSILFTAGHGIALPNGHARQREDQGAVLCSDWPGGQKAPAESHYFAAIDLPPDMDWRGAIVFQFACFSGGTPSQDDFKLIHNEFLSTGEPFLARLPQGMLAPPAGGGALAFVGHVDRVWTHSFLGGGPEEYDQLIYEQTIGRLLIGHPVGYALEFFNRRYAQLAARKALEYDRQRLDAHDLRAFAKTWLMANDARNFVVIGDPAARLQTSDVTPQ